MPSPSVAMPPKRERTRAAIVDAAVTVIAEKGLEAASIDELMNTAGMARGTFYNYFQSRDEVVWAVVDHICERANAEIASRLPPDLTPESLVACMILGFLRFGSDHPELGWAQVHIGGGTPWLIPDQPSRFENVDAALVDLLGSESALPLGIAYIEGVALMALRRVLEERIPCDDVERLVGFILRGLGVSQQKVVPALRLATAFVAEIRADH